jgi:hypothetical protein
MSYMDDLKAKKVFVHAYRVDDGDWYHFRSEYGRPCSIEEREWLLRNLADEAIEDYHDNHDGYEDSFPVRLDLAVRCHFYTFEIEREYVATFSSYLIERKKVKNGSD